MDNSKKSIFKVAFICSGQFISIAGTVISELALAVWAWQQTQQGTTLALMVFFNFAPQIVLAPFIGKIIDRYPKKVSLILSDLGAATATLAILGVLTFSDIQIWHLYAYSLWTGIFNAFHIPSFTAAIPSLVDKQSFVRANSFMSLASSSANIVGPMAAGILLIPLGIRGVLLLDLATFAIATFTVLITRFPVAEAPKRQERSKTALLTGFKYIRDRFELKQLTAIYILINILGAVSMALLAPLILSKVGGDELILGTALTVMGIGGVFGSLLVGSHNKLTEHPLRTVFASILMFSFIGYGGLALSSTPIALFISCFCLSFFVPFMASAYQSIWQNCIPRSVMGSVFAAREAMGQALTPFVYLLVGPLADTLNTRGGIVIGQWSQENGFSIIFLTTAIVGVISALTGLLNPSFNNLGKRLSNKTFELQKL